MYREHLQVNFHNTITFHRMLLQTKQKHDNLVVNNHRPLNKGSIFDEIHPLRTTKAFKNGSLQNSNKYLFVMF